MIANERPSTSSNASERKPEGKYSAMEEVIKTERIQIERKGFIFALKENPRGRFLRITEDVSGRRDAITVPANGLEEFRRVIEDMIKTLSEIPEVSSEAEPPAQAVNQ
jgi:hypothetical protein